MAGRDSGNVRREPLPIALLTNYLTGYRNPLYELLWRRYDVEVLCYGGGERYVPAWFADLDRQLADAPFPARRLTGGAREAFAVSKRYDTVIAPYAGGAILPAAYLGTRRHHTPFVLWASVWAEPQSLKHTLARPLIRRIYRDADSVVAYGEHVRRFVAGIRGRDADVIVAPQSVERELFGRTVTAAEVEEFRARHALPDGPLVLYAGRLVREKGVDVLLEAWPRAQTAGATLVLIGDGPLREHCARSPFARLLGPIPREELPVAYTASEFAVLPSVPVRRFKEPWGLVCNEAMHQARPVIVTSTVGAAAGGLVKDGETGLVVAPGDAWALASAITTLLTDEALRARLGAEALEAVAPYNYEAMAEGFGRALMLSESGRGQARRR